MLGITEFLKCSYGMYCIVSMIHSRVERFSTPLYSHHREVETLTREDRDINGWLHFLRCVKYSSEPGIETMLNNENNIEQTIGSRSSLCRPPHRLPKRRATRPPGTDCLRLGKRNKDDCSRSGILLANRRQSEQQWGRGVY